MSERELVLTVDAGGSSVKASVFSATEATLVSRVRQEYRPSFGRPGYVEFDPPAWWAVIAAACQEAVKRAGVAPTQYAGLICTGMRAPFVLVDQQGEHVAPGVLVADRRGAPYLGQIEHTVGHRELYERTGHWVSSRFGLPKLLWFVHEAPRVLARARYLLQFHDWLVLRLSGVAVSEPSSASMSQMLDVPRRAWAGELLASLGVRESLMPPLVNAGDKVGGLRPDIAAELGLLPGTPVHAGGGDTHIGALGIGAAEVGTVAVVAGSTTAIQLTEDVVRSDDSEGAPLVSAHLQPGRFASETNAGETGVMYRWLRETAASEAGSEDLEALAAQVPAGSGGVMLTAARPRWGEMAWSRLAPVTLFGVRPDHSVGHLARAAIESATFATAAAIDTLLMPGEDSSAARVCALGGATQSSLWSQILADVLDHEVEVAQTPDPAAHAGARLVCPDADALTGTPVAMRTYAPDPERHAVYAPLAARYADVFAQLDAVFGEPA